MTKNKQSSRKQTESSTEDYNRAMERVYQDMMSRHNDPNIQRMRLNNETRGPMMVNAPELQVAMDLANLAQVYQNFTSEKGRNGAWDHKPVMKEILPSFYRKDELTAAEKQPVVFGSKIPGDEEHLYDHDFWGNISYGYTMAAAGYNDWITTKGALADDYLQWWWKNLGQKEKEIFDNLDEPMVNLGIEIYRKYGDKLTMEDLQREIQENSEKLRRYKLEDMETRSVKAKAGENLAQIAEKNGVAKKDMVEELMQNARINPAYSGISDNMSLKEGTRINLPQKANRDYAAITPMPQERAMTALPDKKLSVEKVDKKDEISAAENAIFEALQKNNNPHEDILYKPVEQITENELKNGMRHFLYENQDTQKKQQADEVQKKWYDSHYGIEPVKRDEFGRQIEPQSKRPSAEEEKELQLIGNVPLSQAYHDVANHASPWGVKALQKGLNSFEDADTLKEDGVLGTKTASRTKEALNRYGLDKVKQSIGYGGLSTELEGKRQQPFEQGKLQQTMTAIRPDDGGRFFAKRIKSNRTRDAWL